jgi:hypothetical protein
MINVVAGLAIAVISPAAAMPAVSGVADLSVGAVLDPTLDAAGVSECRYE